MHHQANVGLVHAHAERVGSDNDLELAALERVLNVLFIVGLEPGMKVLAVPPMADQKVRELLGALAAGDEDHRPALVAAQFVFEQRLGVVALLGPGARQHLEMQVGALVGTDEALEGNAELVLEVLLDVFEYIGFGSRREAADGGQFTVAGELLDEARDVEVVRAKVCAPFGQAVRFIKDPSADLALGDGPAKGLVAKLLG